MFTHGETVTILRESPGGFDAYGDPVASTTTRIDVPNSSVTPLSTSEPLVLGRNGLRIDRKWMAPPGSDIRYTDRAEYKGLVYLIDGDAGHWVNPYTGTDFGFEVLLQRKVG